MPSSIHASVMLALLWVAAATAADQAPPVSAAPVSFGGRYPHLAVSNEQGECGIGAVVPWAGKLWFITYGPHLPLGSDDGLYEVDQSLALTRRPESVGGTPAARLIHRETDTLAIGPYLIDKAGSVHAIPPAEMEGRLTAHARGLTHPDRSILVYDMEGLLYELDLESRKAKRLFARAVPGWHGKGGYSGQGVLVVANNGEHTAGSAKKFEPFDYAVPTTRANQNEAGALAEWDGTTWKLIRRRQFTDVTGPGGILGPPSPDAPLWAIGWDEKSVLLMVRSAADAAAGRDPWHTFRLPIACASYTGDHGWHTEWPRIREVVPAAGDSPARFILTMHGGWYELPGTFSAENPAGLRPLCSHLKITGDVAPWQVAGRKGIVFGCDDTAKSGFKTELHNTCNDLNGRSNSNLWFTTWEGLRELGEPAGTAYVWRREAVKAGVPSDPLLLAGYATRVVHLAHGGTEPATFTLSAGSADTWHELAKVTVPPKGSVFEILPADVAGDWVRVTADRDLPQATAVFRYGRRGRQMANAGLFAALADATSYEPWTAAVVRSAAGADLPLDVLATPVEGGIAGASQTWRIGMAGERIGPAHLLDAAGEAAKLLRGKAIPASPTVEFDAASVILREGKQVFRLPKPLDPAVAAAYEQPFATGWPRGLREVVTERALLNAAGTFYVLPRTTSGGAARLQPVCSHGKKITDFCSWRGLLVLGGVRAAAAGDPRVIGPDVAGESAGGPAAPAVWVGDIDELWKLPRPTGRGGPWHGTAITAGAPSDSYLMAGYDRKRLEVSHDAREPVTVAVEVDPAGDGDWLPYATLAVPPGETARHEFPAGYSAHWVRVTADHPCTATATFTYE
jgi:hypothetical protein